MRDTVLISHMLFWSVIHSNLSKSSLKLLLGLHSLDFDLLVPHWKHSSFQGSENATKIALLLSHLFLAHSQTVQQKEGRDPNTPLCSIPKKNALILRTSERISIVCVGWFLQQQTKEMVPPKCGVRSPWVYWDYLLEHGGGLPHSNGITRKPRTPQMTHEDASTELSTQLQVVSLWFPLLGNILLVL